MNILKKIYNRFISKKTPEELEIEYLVSRGMRVGNNSHLFSANTIDHIYPHLISIGNDVTISTNVTILAHDASTNVVKCGTKLGRVTIGDNVFIGTGTTILCNVKIGNNVIIGAQSLVTHDLPDNGVYAGIPVKRICSIEDYQNRYQAMREVRPDFSKIRPWYQWKNASEDEKQQMVDGLKDGVGFI